MLHKEADTKQCILTATLQKMEIMLVTMQKNERVCTMKSPWEQGDTFYFVQSFQRRFGILVMSTVSREKGPRG